MKRRTLVGLGIAAAAAVGGAVLLTPREAPPPPPSTAQLAFPGLAQRLAGASRVEIRRADATLVLERQGAQPGTPVAGETWLLPAKSGYPARGERVREMLVGLTELRLTERRTANPELLDQLGLEDPARPGATSVLLRVLDAGGAPIVELVTGRRRVRTQGNVPESIYVRRPAETQAWLAEGRLPLDTDPQLWIDRDVANLPRERVQRVAVARGAERLELVREGEALRIAVPADAPPADEIALDEIGRGFEFLTFQDVKREAELGGEAVGEAVFTMTDNLSVTVRTSREGEAVWVRLAAAGDDEAARLNARWRGWAYQLGAWKEKAFAPRLEDLKARERNAPAPGAEAPAPPPAR